MHGIGGSIYSTAIITAPKQNAHPDKLEILLHHIQQRSVLVERGDLSEGPVIVRNPLGQLHWLMFTVTIYDMLVYLFIVNLMSLAALYCDQSAKVLQENDAASVFATVVNCCPIICSFLLIFRLAPLDV